MIFARPGVPHHQFHRIIGHGIVQRKPLFPIYGNRTRAMAAAAQA
jgi:hypothetical protein